MSTGIAGPFRLGIDVGGTFTDFALADVSSGTIISHKEPSVPEDPSKAVETGIAALLARHKLHPSDIELIVHGTTLAVNAIIQRRGAKLALVVSQGHRGILEIGRARLANSYDFTVKKEEPLVPRNLVFDLPARIMFDGRVIAEPTQAELDALASQLRAAGVDAVAVMLLHSYAHPGLELRVVEELRRRLPDLRITASSQIWPERREYERCSVALMNAYVQPLMEDYLDKLAERVRGLGVKAQIYITANNGGSLSLETSRNRPIDTVLSGPASGVVAAMAAAEPIGVSRLLTVDIGGTSADFARVEGKIPHYTTQTQIGEFPLVLPVVDVRAIGAGGGSIVWVDPQGVLKVGPESAGAKPGPVCYGKGGTRPTITDCYLVIGLLNPDNFLSGRLRLDAAAARAALAGIAAKLGMSGANAAVEAADAALRVATAMMSTELFKGLSEFGEDPREYALMGFGGAGPTHANLIAEESGITTVVLPPSSATFCALGAIMADVKRDYVRSDSIILHAAAREHLQGLYVELGTEAREWISREGDIIGEAHYEATLDMRYEGQAFDLRVTLSRELHASLDLAAIIEAFHLEHEKIYGFRDLESAVEVTTVRLRIVGAVSAVSLQLRENAGGPATPVAQRQVFISGHPVQVPVYARESLSPETVLSGPVLVEQADTTSWVLPGWTVRADAYGNLILKADTAASRGA
jgi:N-methylhydantoinase A